MKSYYIDENNQVVVITSISFEAYKALSKLGYHIVFIC
jgi:hypothetical protein